MVKLTPGITLTKSCDTVNLYELVRTGAVIRGEGIKDGVKDGVNDGCREDGRTVGSDEGLEVDEEEDIDGDIEVEGI